jgi:penicillin-binding protein 1C
MRARRQRLPLWLEFGLIGGFILAFFIVGGIFLWASFVAIPSINNFQSRKVAESTKIYDRTGNVVLYDVHGAMRRTAVPLTEISPDLQHAAIAVEDNTFYQNAGFRPLSFLRAMAINVFSGSYAQGGSTITQQVVKNSLLSQNKTILRKLQEIILALRLTHTYSKDEILNTYLNETSYGGTIYGVQEASQYFFGVDAKDVDLSQAAYLSALPQAPTFFSPYGNHRGALDTRKNFVLKQMLENKFITQDAYDVATKEVVQFRDETEAGIKAPHFVFYVREYLERKYGADAVSDGGLRVITTLDYDLQKKAEDTVAKWAPDMEKNFNATNEGIVAIDPKTGQILAMVGSRGYFDPTIDGKVNITLANRQPGSSFKPFVYATAFKKGYTPDTVVFDLQTQFSTHCEPTDTTNDEPPCYSPSNFDGTFKGPMTLRNAIAQSENVPSVKTLYLAGIPESLATARDMGITTLGDANQYGLTLVLGGGEVNLLELTGAYGAFANDGVRNPPVGILRVESTTGTVLESYADQSARVLDPQIARQINDILSDNIARTPEFGATSPLYFPNYNVADKTGTTNDFHDVWVLGYTPGIAVGAWAGNNDNSPMAKKIAAFIIAPMWHEFMSSALEKYSATDDNFPSPAPDSDISAVPPVLAGNWNTDPALGVHDILYWIDKNNPRAGRPLSPQSDSQFAYWDYPVSLWAQQDGKAMVSTYTAPNTLIPAAPLSGFQIVSPAPGAAISFGFPTTFTAAYQGVQPISSVLYYVNGGLIGTASQAPFAVSYTPNLRGPLSVRAVAISPNGSRMEQTSTFIVQ